MSKSRQFVFTINNPESADYLAITALFPQVEYIVWGKERGESGTLHYQGYVIFKNPRTLSGVSKLLTRAHLEVARASPGKNEAYCKKDGDWEEYAMHLGYDYNGSIDNPIVIHE